MQNENKCCLLPEIYADKKYNIGKLKVIVPTILGFLKNCYRVAKLKDNIIKHRLNPIASIKTLVKHQLRVNKGHMQNGRVNNRVSVYQTKIRIGD